jgi:hypothetical protein
LCNLNILCEGRLPPHRHGQRLRQRTHDRRGATGALQPRGRHQGPALHSVQALERQPQVRDPVFVFGGKFRFFISRIYLTLSKLWNASPLWKLWNRFLFLAGNLVSLFRGFFNIQSKLWNANHRWGEPVFVFGGKFSFFISRIF